MPWALGRKLCKTGQSPERETRAGGELSDGMLAWHGLGPRTAGREDISVVPKSLLCLNSASLRQFSLRAEQKNHKEGGKGRQILPRRDGPP